MNNVSLYALTVFFWGTSWLAIKFQLGVVAPEVSVLYRIAAAAAILNAYCLLTRRPMRFSPRDHRFMALQGLFLFSANYVLVYLGSQYLTSGLVLVLAGTALASLGMLTSARNQKHELPVVQTNAFGMAYGALVLTALTVGLDRPFDFDTSFAYVASLLYLALFATVLAFGCYLTLLGRIGADRAAYASVLFPIVALALSTVFEGFHWTVAAALGIVMVLVGNALIVTRGPVVGRRLADRART